MNRGETGTQHCAARAVLALLAGCAVAVASAWVLDVHPRDLARHFRGVSSTAILGCILSACIVYALQAFRRHLVMHERAPLGYVDVFAGHVLGTAFNTLLPARGGDLVRVEYFARRSKRSRSTLIGVELVDRWLHCAGWFPPLAVLALAGLLPRWFGTGFSAVALVLAVWGVAMMIVARRRALEPTRGSRVREAIASLRDGLGGFRAWRTIWIGLVVAPLPWLWEAAVVAIAARAFGIHLTFGGAFAVLVGFNIATIVPSPGSVGSVEAGGALALALLGVDHSAALAFMFVYHLTQLVPAVIAGIGVVVVRAALGQRSSACTSADGGSSTATIAIAPPKTHAKAHAATKSAGDMAAGGTL